jgi:hypothetical protein
MEIRLGVKQYDAQNRVTLKKAKFYYNSLLKTFSALTEEN